MRLLPRPLGGSQLVQDYLSGADSAAVFYRGSPFRKEIYRRKAAELEGSTGPDAIARVVPMIRPAGPVAEQALREVASEGGYFVTTGQQPGLFGGALYSLYKALTAVQLARTLAAELGRPVMPLFWVASEDHDWDEANQAHVVDRTDQLRLLALDPGPARVRRSLGRVRLGEGIRDIAHELGAHFAPSPFHESCMQLVGDTFRPSATMASAFSDFMAELLRDTPVGLVDAAGPALKEASRPILRAEAEDPSASEAAVRESSNAVARGGYPLQVALVAGAVNLFVESARGRERLRHRGGAYSLRASGRTVSRAEIVGLIDDDPQMVSPNVLLRPVVESFIFPTLAYVGGPGELAYFAQLPGLFERHRVGMPVVVPRGSLLAVETKVDRAMRKFGLDADELREGSGLLGRLARDQLPDDLSDGVAGWREGIESRAAQVLEAAAAIDPVLKGAVAKARNSGLAALGAMEKKVARAVKRRNETTWKQVGKARMHLWPAGKPQDRVLGPLQYLMRYGPDFVTMALDELAAGTRFREDVG